jgi:hypothetical protein
MAVQPELSSSESVLWAGQPSRRIIFHKQDWFMIPFSLFWGGFAIFWEGAVAGLWGSGNRPTGSWVFGMIWGIPFVVIGQYLVWGRFFYAAWKKKRIHYGVTNRRVIVVQEGPKRHMASAYLDTLPVLIKEIGSKGIGTLRFAPLSTSPRNRTSGDWDIVTTGTVPTFVDVEDVESVYRLVSDLREKTRTEKATT